MLGESLVYPVFCFCIKISQFIGRFIIYIATEDEANFILHLTQFQKGSEIYVFFHLFNYYIMLCMSMWT